jgi:predicted SAM-dependent methyltransferase
MIKLFVIIATIISITLFCIFTHLYTVKQINEYKEYQRQLAKIDYDENYKINKKIYQDYIKRKKEDINNGKS